MVLLFYVQNKYSKVETKAMTILKLNAPDYRESIKFEFFILLNIYTYIGILFLYIFIK